MKRIKSWIKRQIADTDNIVAAVMITVAIIGVAVITIALSQPYDPTVSTLHIQ